MKLMVKINRGLKKTNCKVVTLYDQGKTFTSLRKDFLINLNGEKVPLTLEANQNEKIFKCNLTIWETIKMNLGKKIDISEAPIHLDGFNLNDPFFNSHLVEIKHKLESNNLKIARCEQKGFKNVGSKI